MQQNRPKGRDKKVQEAIDYLLGLDPIERWPDDLGFPPSPEDYGTCCIHKLVNLEQPGPDAIAALIKGAIAHPEELIRSACADGLATIRPELGCALHYLQTLDEDEDVRENAFELLWHSDRSNPQLARTVCDRLLNDGSDLVRDVARLYKRTDPASTPLV